MSGACDRVVAEIGRQAESDRKLVAGACQSGELVDRALIWLEAGTLDDERRLSLSRIVPEERQAFDLDELVLATADGERLGQDPITLLNTPRAELAKLVGGDVAHFSLRASPKPALVARCRKQGTGGHAVGLVGARRLEPVVERLSHTIDAQVTLDAAPAARPDVAQASCALKDASGASIPIVVSKSTRERDVNLARIDQTVIYAGLASTGVALVIALLLARGPVRRIQELAAEARKVASGEARPVRVRGERRDRRAGAVVRQDARGPRGDAPAPRGDDPRGGVAGGRATRRPRGEEPPGSHPRRRRDAAAPARAQRSRVRQVLRRGDAHGARRGAPHREHRDRVHALRAPARAATRRTST